MSNLDALLPLESGTTLLRRFRSDDVARFHAYRSDAELARFQGWSPMTLPQAQAFVEEMAGISALQPGEWVQLAICDQRADELLGDLGLFLEPDGATAEVGFTLARAAQGKGHATRALRAAVALIYAASAATTVRAVTDARNVRSIRTLERADFALFHSRSAVFKGEDCTELVYTCRR